MAITRFSWYGSSKLLETFRNNHPKLPLFSRQQSKMP